MRQFPISNFQFPKKLNQKLQENKDQAFFSKKLATIVRTVEIDFTLDKTDWRKNLDRQNIEKTFRDFGFYSLGKRLDDLGLQANGQLELEPAVQKVNTGADLKELKTQDDFNGFAKEAKKNGKITCYIK